MKVVIMAGGEGTRLRPLTCTKPKPMVPMANRPVMEHIVNLVKKYGFTEIAVTLQYMPEVIKDYFFDGSDFGVEMNYFVEDTPLGTAGSVKNAEDFLDDTFVVISGDALTDIDISKAVEFHFRKGSIATLILKKVDVPLEYGVVVVDSEGKVVRFLEKPSWGEVFSDTANTGIYILSPEIFKFIKKGERFDFSKDLFPILLKNQLPMYGYVTEDYWCDIGDLRAYEQAHRDILDGRVKLEISGNRIMDNVWVGDNVSIDENALIKGPCIIGNGSNIGSGALIDSYCIIGDACKINESASIKRSILWNNCIVDKNVEIRGGILGEKVCMKKSSSLFEQAVIGDNTIINEWAVIKPDIKIWPNKKIEAGTEVNSNLVWGSMYTKSVFGRRGIAGEINIDITPEYASKLGAAYGATFMKGKSRVCISTDNSSASHMLKMSFVAGMLSSGVDVIDFGELLLPMVRLGVRFHKLDGGVHINTLIDEQDRLFMDFIDKNGATIDRAGERKIENLFIREDFNRSAGKSIRKLNTIHGIDSFYKRSIINAAKSNKLGYSVIVNARSDFTHETLKEILTDLGCRVEATRLKALDNSGGFTDIFNETEYFSDYVRMSKADVGVLIDDTAEKMALVDEKGRAVGREEYIALVSLIIFKSMPGATIFIPVSSSYVIEQLSKTYKGNVVRTKTSEQDIMGTLLKNDSDSAKEQFALYFDAIAGLTKILDFMKAHDYRLSQLIDMIPDMYIKEKVVDCPWNAKGTVIRKIMQDATAGKTETTEGVKIFHDKGWVLVLPDAERPTCKVIGEGYSEEYAEELVQIYAQKVIDIGSQSSE